MSACFVVVILYGNLSETYSRSVLEETNTAIPAGLLLILIRVHPNCAVGARRSTACAVSPRRALLASCQPVIVWLLPAARWTIRATSIFMEFPRGACRHFMRMVASTVCRLIVAAATATRKIAAAALLLSPRLFPSATIFLHNVFLPHFLVFLFFSFLFSLVFFLSSPACPK